MRKELKLKLFGKFDPKITEKNVNEFLEGNITVTKYMVCDKFIHILYVDNEEVIKKENKNEETHSFEKYFKNEISNN